MSGYNTTGKPRTKDYLLGRGCLMLAELDANDQPLGYRILGNAPSFTMTGEEEVLEHFSSKEGVRAKDAEVSVSKDVNWTCELDEINWQNLALFFSGDASETKTNAAKAGITEWQLVPDGGIEVELNYLIFDSSGNRAMGITGTNALVVATTNATPVTLTEGTDYEVDADLGAFFLLDTAPVQTAITNGEGLTVAMTADASVNELDDVTILSGSTANVALTFKGENPQDNNKVYVAEINKTKAKADGDLSLIQESDWTVIPLNGAAEKSSYSLFQQYGGFGRFYQLKD